VFDWLNNACLGVSQCSFSIICFVDDIVVVGKWNEGVDCELELWTGTLGLKGFGLIRCVDVSLVWLELAMF